MNFNPHALHQILTRIREQMRCPQCGTRIDVDFPSVRVAGGDFMLLQVKCQSCAAFIVLHVNLTDRSATIVGDQPQPMLNASSTLTLSDDEMATLRSALKTYEGSFENMFKDIENKA